MSNVDDIARGIIAAARARWSDPDAQRAAIVAVGTAMAESAGHGRVLNVWANDGTSTLVGSAEKRGLNPAERAMARQSMAFDHDQVGNNLDSMGLYQQRPMSGWGDPADLMDPVKAAGKFFDGAGGNRGLRWYNGEDGRPDWRATEPWAAGQRVQGSLPKDAPLYRSYQTQATTMVERLWNETGSATVTTSTASATSSTPGATNTDWFTMATAADLTNALGGLAGQIITGVRAGADDVARWTVGEVVTGVRKGTDSVGHWVVDQLGPKIDALGAKVDKASGILTRGHADGKGDRLDDLWGQQVAILAAINALAPAPAAEPTATIDQT